MSARETAGAGSGARRVVRLVAVLAIAVAGALVWLAGPGVTIDGHAWRVRVAEALARASGRPVAIDGAMRLHLALDPWIELRELRVGRDGERDTARVGEARIALALVPLLAHRRVEVRELRARDVLFERRAGTGDATVRAGAPGAGATSPAPHPGAVQPMPGDGASAATGWRPRGLGVDRIVLEALEWRLSGADGSRHAIVFERVEGTAGAGQPVALALAMAVDARARVAVELRGGSIDALVDGDAPWPLSLRATMAGSALVLEGAIDAAPGDAPRPLAGHFTFGIGTPDAQSLAPVLRATIPPLGPTSLAGRVRLHGDRLTVDDLVGTMGESRLDGALRVAFGQERIGVAGRLDVSRLDLGPFFGAADASARGAGARTTTVVDWYRAMSDARFDPVLLRALDADLDLTVGQWRGLPGDVRDARLSLRLTDGLLAAPLGVVFAGVRFDGELAIDARGAEPAFSLTVGSRDTALGDLAEVLFALPGVDGALGGVALHAQAEGRDAAAVVRSLQARVVVARGGFTYGNRPGERPVAFGLDSLVVDVPSGGRLRAEGGGTLLGQPLDLTLDAGSLAEMLAHGRTPLALALRSRSASVRADGTLAQLAGGRADGVLEADLAIAVRATRARDLANWLGLAGRLDAPFAADLRLHARTAAPDVAPADPSVRAGAAGPGVVPAVAPPTAWALRSARVRLGETRVEGEVERRVDAAGARIVARVRAQTVDVDELQTLLARAGPGPARDAGALFDLPILPGRVDAGVVDLSLAVGVVRGTALDLRELSFETRLRGARMLASPMAMTVLGVPVSGALELDLRGAEPRAQWWLQAQRADLGAILRRLRLAERIDASVDSVRLHVDARGARLGDMLDRSAMSVELEGGRIALRDPNSGAVLDVAIANGSLNASAGAPVHGALLGALDGEPIALAISSGRVRDLVDPRASVPVHAEVSVASARVTLDGRLARDVASPELRLALAVAGERIADWQPIARVSLPPWGPYSLEGRLALTAQGYAVEGLRLAVGASRLAGRGSLLTRASPPRLAIDLAASAIQLDDFPFGAWRPFGDAATGAKAPPAAAPLPANALDAIREKARRASDDVARLFGAETLARLDAEVSVRVDAVHAGADRLGDGRLVLAVSGGRARLGPLRVALPGGSLEASLDYAPSAESVDVDARLALDSVDVGVLARRVRAQTTLGGRISLDLALRSRAPSLAKAMAHGNGRLAFRVWPENLRADVFDLWATNLFVALVDRLDPQSQSRINCGAGEFALADGRLESRRLLIDTTRVRVSGSGHADFRDETIALRMAPQPKRAEFFSLATPIRVSGRFDDYTIGADAGDVVATGVRLLTSLLWVPLSKLAGSAPAADGADVCAGTGATLPPLVRARTAPADAPAPSGDAFDLPGGP